MKISIIGCGYVGLVVGACLAKLGNNVTIVDIDEEKVRKLNEKVCPLYEEGLAEIIRSVDIEVTSDYRRVAESSLVFVCVGTPSKADGSISLNHVTEAAEQVAGVLGNESCYQVIVVKSTVVPGTTEEVVIPILESSGKSVGPDFGVCMVPEFLREGKALYDFKNPARIILGEYDKRSGDMVSDLYQGFDVPIVRIDLKTAEMIKYASNAFLAAKISFINEIGNICKRLGIDTYEVARGMGLDERIGSKFLNSGIGFGGPCLRKDLTALIARAKQIGYEPRILEEVLTLNDEQALRVIQLLKKHLTLKDSSIGLLGLSYRPGTDDVRDSRAITLVNGLLQEGATVKVYDPRAMDNFKELFPQIAYVDPEEVLGCDAIVIVTEWEEFEQLDYRGRIVIDGRRISKATEAAVYEGVCW